MRILSFNQSLSINAPFPSCRTRSGIQKVLKELDSGFRRNDDLFGYRLFMDRLFFPSQSRAAFIALWGIDDYIRIKRRASIHISKHMEE